MHHQRNGYSPLHKQQMKNMKNMNKRYTFIYTFGYTVYGMLPQCSDASVFCPPGAVTPLPVSTGYYTIGFDENSTRYRQQKCEPGHYCIGGVKYLCDRGYYGAEFGMTQSNCSGLCSPGYYCPPGSISSTEIMCGDPNLYCPEGSYEPKVVDLGYYSIGNTESTRYSQRKAPIGHFASLGLMYTCAAGYFGATEGLYTPECSGHCNADGYYCPAGSISPFMFACGGDDYYCPARVVAPIRVDEGFYTIHYLRDQCPPGTWRNWSLTVDVTIGEPSVVVTESSIPDCQLCPNNTYKYTIGDDLSLCLPCNTRHASTAPDRRSCICDTIVAPGYISYFNHSTGDCNRLSIQQYQQQDQKYWRNGNAMTRYYQMECEPGYYCKNGLRFLCSSGTFGAQYRNSNSSCSGPCSPGYYCPGGSSIPTQVPCGAAHLICPLGSSIPKVVPMGYYSNEDVREDIRSYETICPPGYYCPGDGRRYLCPSGTYATVPGSTSDKCQGLCEQGFFCREGSTSPTQFECGSPNTYCVRGSSAPTPVTPGFYGIFTGVDAGARALWNPRNTTFSAEIPCEPGYYCIDGLKYPCAPGYFGWRYGMNSSSCGGKCARGFYCPSYLNPIDNTEAPAHTQWPQKPHVSAAELKCGGTPFFCPAGSMFPLLVGGGNYTIGGDSDNTTRYDQRVCTPGTFCRNGIRFNCPKGRFGATAGLTDPSCTAPCPAGYYCPEGTYEPFACPPNTYSQGSGWVCAECPGNRSPANPAPCKDSRSCCFR